MSNAINNAKREAMNREAVQIISNQDLGVEG
jgi:hypothetical protein